MPGAESLKRRAALLIAVLLLGACRPAPPTGPTPTATALAILPGLVPADPATPHPRQRTPAAPAVREITFNVPVELIFTPGDLPELYVFYINEAGRVRVTLDPLDGGGTLRLEALLFDANGSRVTRAPGGDEWELPSSGEYTIRVFGAETGARTFALTVLRRPTAESGGGMIAYGESRSGRIAVYGQRDYWVFEGHAGDRVLISMTAPGHDGLLALYGPAGELVGQNDDAGAADPNPALEVTLASAGRYIIAVRLYGSDQAGAYRLALERLP